MVAFNRGPDIIKALRHAHPEIGEGESVGVVSSFCKDARVERDQSRKRIEIVATLSTDDIDTDNERVLPDGIDIDTYLLKNRNVFVDHCYDMLSCVGKFRSITRKSNGLACRIQMLNNADNPLIGAVISLAEAGSCPMSMGFAKKVGGPPTREEQARYLGKAYMVRKCMAVEGSFTAMPANVDCQSGGITYSEEKSANYRDILVKSKVPESLWPRLGIPAKPRKVIVWLGAA